MDDRELIRRIQSGQKEYLNTVAEKYYDDIYYFCAYQTGSREDAYDLAQEAFLRFIRYVENYKYQNLKGYLLTIAMNLCRNYIREMARLPDALLDVDADMGADGRAYPHTYAKSQNVQRESPDSHPESSLVLAQALRKLPDVQREAVLLHHFYGYKNREIAHMTGASYAAVKSRVKQGLMKLQDLLNEEDFYGQ